MPDERCRMRDARREMPDERCQTRDVRREMPDARQEAIQEKDFINNAPFTI
jgi:hypothetical protein